MKQSAVNQTHFRTALPIWVGAIWMVTTTTLSAAEIQVGRYSVLTSTPHEFAEPFTPITIRFSEQVQTVGDAVRDLLKRHGYGLIAIESIEPETKSLFALSLPSADRSLGPMSLRQALQKLAGAPFRVALDSVTRVVIFDHSKNEISNVEQGLRDE